jgi:hypothetical protein
MTSFKKRGKKGGNDRGMARSFEISKILFDRNYRNEGGLVTLASIENLSSESHSRGM